MRANQFISGALAGAVATIPMTIALEAIRRRLPPSERFALEPRLISDQVLRKLPIRRLTDAQRAAIASVLHVAYGSSVGAALRKVPHHFTRSPSINGSLTGFALWAVGYMGWLPLLRILPPPEKRPHRRNLAIITAHLVWGVAHEYAIRQLNNHVER